MRKQKKNKNIQVCFLNEIVCILMDFCVKVLQNLLQVQTL